MTEEWRPIKGHEGYYEVSNQGRVRSKDRDIPITRNGVSYSAHLSGKELKPFKNWKGYLVLNMCGRTIRIHRMVAEAFIPNPEGKPEVNHKDSNRCNNSVSNLEWCTSSENAIHGFKFGKRKPRPKSKNRRAAK